jgi:hypothetical protein
MFMKHVSSVRLSFWIFDDFGCDYFLRCVSCTVVVLTCFVMCGCFDNCVSVLVICVLVFTVFCIVCTVFVLFRLRIFILTFFAYTSTNYCHRVKTQLQ